MLTAYRSDIGAEHASVLNHNLSVVGKRIGWNLSLMMADRTIDPNLKIIKALPISALEDLHADENTRREIRRLVIREVFNLGANEYDVQSVKSLAPAERIKEYLNDPRREADRAAGADYVLIQTKDNEKGPAEYQLWVYKPRVSAYEQEVSRTA